MKERIQRVLDLMSYKPNTRFLCANNIHTGGIEIYVATKVPDVHEPSKTIDLSTTGIIDPDADLEAVVDTVRGLLLTIERHEVAEWFKFDGKCVDDPHPGQRRA